MGLNESIAYRVPPSKLLSHPLQNDYQQASAGTFMVKSPGGWEEAQIACTEGTPGQRHSYRLSTPFWMCARRSIKPHILPIQNQTKWHLHSHTTCDNVKKYSLFPSHHLSSLLYNTMRLLIKHVILKQYFVLFFRKVKGSKFK